jgi:RecT family
MNDQNNSISNAVDTPSMSRSDFSAVQFASAERAGGGLRLALNSFAEAEKFANLMSVSNFVPKHLRGKPADCLAVLLQSLRWEMDPFAVAQKTYFVNDGMGYEAQLINAIINARAPLSGRLDIKWAGEGDNLSCTVSGMFKGETEPKVRTAHFKTITTKNSPLWKQDPQQQLAYFTQRAWARLYCPDVILGVYTKEEMETGGMIDVTNSAAATIENELRQEVANNRQGHDPVTGEVKDPKSDVAASPSLQDWLDDIASAPTPEGVDHKYGQATDHFLTDHGAMAALTLAKTQRKQALALPKPDVAAGSRKLFQKPEGAAA